MANNNIIYNRIVFSVLGAIHAKFPNAAADAAPTYITEFQTAAVDVATQIDAGFPVGTDLVEAELGFYEQVIKGLFETHFNGLNSPADNLLVVAQFNKSKTRYQALLEDETALP